MFKSLKKKNNKGFTLVELVIVVAILAILAGILAPQYTKYVEKSRKAADASNLENLVTVVKTAAADSTDVIPVGEYTITITATATTLDGDDTSKTVENVITELAVNDWKSTKLKSKKWGQDISATIKIEDNGKTTVTYDPESIKNTANN